MEIKSTFVDKEQGGIAAKRDRVVYPVRHEQDLPVDVTGRAGQSMTTLWQAGLFMSIKKVTRRVRAWLKQKISDPAGRKPSPHPPG